ncbi:MAG: amino acid--tRNA ligase-related protein [Nitrososphaerales archaeon]
MLSPNVRIEKRERKATGWHAFEFTQLDFEIQSAKFRDVKSLVEDLIVGLIEHVKRNTKNELLSLDRYSGLKRPEKPFKVYDRTSLLSKYGEDWEKRLALDIEDPAWVTNIPREFYDYEDLESGRWNNYDLFVPRYGEILSGAEREWNHEKISSKMERDGVKKENYSILLKMAKEGRLQPSAGAGIGIERLVGWIVGTKHVGEVQPFPKVPGIVHEL